MKYHIDTIPIWDAFKEDCECPICVITDKLEIDFVKGFLGGSLMESDIRIAVNKKGFCRRHFNMLYYGDNRLGLGLMAHTHLREGNREFEALSGSILKTAQSTRNSNIAKRTANRIKNGSSIDSEIDKMLTWLDEKNKSCMICEKLDYSIDRYCHTLLHMWGHEEEFRETFNNSKGFCRIHLSSLLRMSQQSLSEKKRAEFIIDLMPLINKEYKRLDEELLWFTKKFDYRNREKPWGNSKTALPRVLKKLMGGSIEKK